MKDWFPFTDYDFYSYLACGLVLLFGLDYWYSGGQYLMHGDWTFFQGALTIALAYVAGQIVAIPSSMLFEHFLTRKVLRPPAVLLLANTQYRSEKFIEALLVGRHYSPLPKGTIEKVFTNAAKDTGIAVDKLKKDIKEVFIPALEAARKMPETRDRIEFFRNQYTFCRNMAMSGLITTALLIDCAIRSENSDAKNWIWISLLATIGMLIRFLKFYSCCAAEALKAYSCRDHGV